MAYSTDIKIKLAQQADKVVNALVIQTNGTTRATYNGSAAATVNITAATVGAAASSHTHNYAGSSSAGGAANSVKTSLIIKLNGGTTEGTNQFTFNGSAAKTINITASSIGASASSHTHSYLPLSGGTLTGQLTVQSNITAASGTVKISSNHIDIGTKACSWETARTGSNATINITTKNSADSYHPIIYGKTYNNHIWTFGSYKDAIGIYGFKASSTGGSAINATLDISTGVFGVTGDATVGGTLTAANGSVKIESSRISVGNKVSAWTDAEGGNIRCTNNAGTFYWEFDTAGGTYARLLPWDIANNRSCPSFFFANNGEFKSTQVTASSKMLCTDAQVNNVLTVGTNGVRIWRDNEGGNIRVYTPSGSTYYEMDAVQNVFRLYYSNPYKVIFQTDTSGNLNVPTSISTASLTVTSIRCNSNIEMYGPTPYIDFHYNNSTADYTARIIADTANRLHIQASGGLQVSNGLNVSGTIKATSEMFQTISGETWHWGPGCGTGVATRFGIRRQSNGYTFYFDGATGGMYLGGVIQAGGLSTTGNIDARTLNLSGSAVAQTDLIVNGTVYFNGSKSRFMSNGIWIGGYTTSGTPSGPNIRFFGPVHDFYGWSNLTSASRPCCYITDGSSQAYDNGNVRFARYVSSSRRFKNTITQEFDDTCNPEKLYELPVVTYHYNKNYDSSDKEGKKLHIGFIAEDVDELFPIACGYEDDGKTPENWNHMELIPGMMKLIQDQHKEILDLQDRVKTLEAQMIEVLNLLSK